MQENMNTIITSSKEYFPSLLPDMIQTRLQLCLEEETRLNVYWGVAPVKTISLNILIPLLKLREFVRTGICDCTVLIADVHSYLDRGFNEIEKIRERTEYYKHVISVLLFFLGIPEVSIVVGSSFQYSQEYMFSLMKFSTLVTCDESHRAISACSDSKTKNLQSSSIGRVLYPLLQCLDEQFLKADLQIGDSYQKKIFELSRKNSVRENNKNITGYIIVPTLFEEKGRICFGDSIGVVREKLSMCGSLRVLSSLIEEVLDGIGEHLSDVLGLRDAPHLSDCQECMNISQTITEKVHNNTHREIKPEKKVVDHLCTHLEPLLELFHDETHERLYKSAFSWVSH